MTFGKKDDTPADKAIIPFLAIGFSVIVALIASRYASWFSHPLPALTVYYLAWWPVWLVINVLELVVGAIVKAMRLERGQGGMLRKIDATLNPLSALTLLVGMIALAIPAAARFFPG